MRSTKAFRACGCELHQEDNLRTLSTAEVVRGVSSNIFRAFLLYRYLQVHSRAALRQQHAQQLILLILGATLGYAHCQRQRATCQLLLQGQPGRFAGVQDAVLNCRTVPAGGDITVGVNSSIISQQQAASFTGVRLVNGYAGCEASPNTVAKPTTALVALPPPSALYFCGEYDISFVEPRAQDVWLASDYVHGVVTIGGNVNASIMSGVFAGGRGSQIVVSGTAALHVRDTTISSNIGVIGAGILALHNSSVQVHNSSLSSNSALARIDILPAAQMAGEAADATAEHIKLPGSGGAVAADNFAQVTLVNSKITNCTAAVVGGGIMGFLHAGITVVDSVISFCHVAGSSTGEDTFGGGGAAVSDYAVLISNNSAWINNTAASAGGLLAGQNASVFAWNSVWEGNSAWEAGAAVILGCLTDCGPGHVHAEFEQCLFVANRVPGGDDSAWGAAAALLCVDNATVVVNGSVFERNEAAGDGGAVVAGSNVQLQLQNSVFHANRAGGVGGAVAVYTGVLLNVIMCVFERNAAAAGGSISAQPNCTVNISLSTIRYSNATTYRGGGIMASGSRVQVMDTTMEHNTAVLEGGAMHVFLASDIRISNCRIAHNSGSAGGAIGLVSPAASMVIINTTFLNNTATDRQTGGGAIIVWEGSKMTMQDSILAYNRAITSGGGLAVGRAARALLSNVTLDNNQAASGGAAAVLRTQPPSLHGNLVPAFLECRDSKLVQNSATENGGALLVTGGELGLNASSVLLSKAKSGAGIAVEANSTVNISNSVLAHGHASDSAGCAYVADSSVLTLYNSTCRDSWSGGNSGGLEASSKARLQLLGNTTVVHNRAQAVGGGVSMSSNTTQLVLSHDSAIVSNSATQGGGVFVAGSAFDPVQLMRSARKNTATYNRDVLSSITNVLVMGDAMVKGFVSQLGNDASWLPVRLNVSGFYGIPVEGVQIGANLKGGTFIGSNVSDANGGVFLGLRFRQVPGNYTIQFSSPGRALPPVMLEVEVRSCRMGEVTTSPDTCQVCSSTASKNLWHQSTANGGGMCCASAARTWNLLWHTNALWCKRDMGLASRKLYLVIAFNNMLFLMAGTSQCTCASDASNLLQCMLVGTSFIANT